MSDLPTCLFYYHATLNKQHLVLCLMISHENIVLNICFWTPQLRTYSSCLLPTPKLVLAMSDCDGVGALSSFFSSDVTQELIQEGNSVAESLNATFMTTTANFPQQSKSSAYIFVEKKL